MNWQHERESMVAVLQSGDEAAKGLLRQQLLPDLLVIIRSALRTKSVRTPLARLILAEARQQARLPTEDWQRYLHRLAGRVCDWFFDRLQVGQNGTIIKDDTLFWSLAG